MNKIVSVVNAMISNSEKITNVTKKDKVFFFLYDGKHKWSIYRVAEEDYFLNLYPTNKIDLKELTNENSWFEYEFVTYSTADIKTTEALESFRELFQIVSSKLYGIDEIFDEILIS